VSGEGEFELEKTWIEEVRADAIGKYISQAIMTEGDNTTTIIIK
jgi:hypothetical protein